MADVPSKYKRAFLELHEPRDKGKKMGPVIDTINFSFNPKELTIQRTATGRRRPRRSRSPRVQRRQGGTVNVEMFLDASEGGQVKTTVDKLLAPSSRQGHGRQTEAVARTSLSVGERSPT
jgi:hypothetical protein